MVFSVSRFDVRAFYFLMNKIFLAIFENSKYQILRKIENHEANPNFWMKQRHPNILQVLGVLIDQNYGPVEAPSTQVLLILERCNYDLHSGLKVRGRFFFRYL